MSDSPIVLCGLGRVGGRVLEYLRAAGMPVVVVDTACRADDSRLQGVRLVSGDCRQREVLDAAGVAGARGVLILTGDDLLNVSATLMVRSLNPEVRVVLRMFNQNLLGRLGRTVHNVFALSTSLLTAPVLAATALTGQALGAFRLEGQTDARRQIAEIGVGPGSELRGRTLVEATGWRELLVLAHLKAGGAPRFLLDVDLGERFEEGDRLVVCGDPRSLAPLLSDGEGDALPGLRWAGKLRRWGRVFWRTFAGLDRAVAVCTVVLVAVVAVSTAVIHLGSSRRVSLGHALLRAVSVMATQSGFGEEGDESDAMQVFVSVLRISGAVLTAAFTAIVTNYLIRARLGSALEAVRVPEGGHIVVCGLGPIGFRVVEELAGQGEKVVVVELEPANRFVATVRRLKATVIVGDATVSEVLRQARAGSARAVVSATDKDLVNLEVALLVKELNPDQRVVLLQNDPQLAQMLREGANVRHAVSVPALAAPAFLAGLFGDRVLGVFLVHGRLLAALDLVVQPGDPLAGQAVRAVAVDHRLLPVALLPPSGGPARKPLEARLGAGDRLTAILALPDLERLLRRQPSSAAFAVDVTSFPLPARGWLVGLLRATRGLEAEEAEQALERLPVQLGTNLTRGQAEDLLARLARERVAAKLGEAEWQSGEQVEA